MGEGAVVTIKATSVHPNKLIRDKYPNKNPNKRIIGIVLRQEDKIIWKKVSPCIIFQCDELMDGDVHHELYANLFNFKITQEGPEDKLYNVVEPVPEESKELGEIIVTPLADEFFDQEVVDMFNLGRALNVEDVKFLRGFVPIDDDNDQAPDNIPDSTVDEVGDGRKAFQETR